MSIFTMISHRRTVALGFRLFSTSCKSPFAMKVSILTTTKLLFLFIFSGLLYLFHDSRIPVARFSNFLCSCCCCGFVNICLDYWLLFCKLYCDFCHRFDLEFTKPTLLHFFVFSSSFSSSFSFYLLSCRPLIRCGSQMSDDKVDHASPLDAAGAPSSTGVKGVFLRAYALSRDSIPPSSEYAQENALWHDLDSSL